MQPHRPDRVKQERQQGKEKMHAAGAALDYRARGLTGESIQELLGGGYRDLQAKGMRNFADSGKARIACTRKCLV